jgi:hypothetical protein
MFCTSSIPNAWPLLEQYTTRTRRDWTTAGVIKVWPVVTLLALGLINVCKQADFRVSLNTELQPNADLSHSGIASTVFKHYAYLFQRFHLVRGANAGCTALSALITVIWVSEFASSPWLSDGFPIQCKSITIKPFCVVLSGCWYQQRLILPVEMVSLQQAAVEQHSMIAAEADGDPAISSTHNLQIIET